MRLTDSPTAIVDQPQSGAMPTLADSASGTRLRANALGLLATGALTAAYMAPALSIYNSFGPMVSQVGVAVGFVMVLALLITLPSAISFGMLAKEVPAAGGVYAWATQALGRAVGIWVGLTTAAYYVLTVFFPPIVFGLFFNDLLPMIGVTPTRWTWLAGALLSLAISGSVTYRGIVVSSHLAFTMLMTELAVVAALSFTFLGVAIAHGTFSWDPILPTAAKGGASGILLAVPLALLAMTCDATTPTSEETRDARRTIPLAMVTTCILIGVWYVIGFSAFAMAAPRERLFALVENTDVSPIAPLARPVWGPLEILVTITGMTAAVGSLIPCATAASRVLFAMGRDGTLPRWLGNVHPQFQAPWNALHVVHIATVLAVIPVAIIVGASPTILWWGNIFVWYVSVVYFFANLSNLVYYRRFARERFHLVWNLLVPVFGISVQLLLVWQLVIKELWRQGWFGRSGQGFIIAVAAATAIYAHAVRRRDGLVRT
jgi:amino acid transporter